MFLLQKGKLATKSRLSMFFVSSYYIRKYRMSTSPHPLLDMGEAPKLITRSDLALFDHNNKSIRNRPADD